LNLTGQVIIVTGACGLLGQKIVQELLDHKSYVFATDTDLEKAKNLLKSWSSEHIHFSPMDITDASSIDKAIENCRQKFGSVNACVNAAYPRTESWGAQFEKVKMLDIQENLKLQLGGAILLSQRMMKDFVSQGHGNFIHLSSIMGVVAPKFENYEGTTMTSPIEYSAIKSGIISMTSWLAKYYKNKNIRVNCVSPGGIIDQQSKIFLEKYRNSCSSKGMLDPSDIVGTVLFLLSDQSKYINGQNIIVDDGWSL